MIKKLYECGCFNFQKFILEHTKPLALNSDEAVILIKILEGWTKEKTLSSEALVADLSMTKAKADKALASLLERGFYEIYINYDQGIGQEYISLDGFFQKVSAVLDANLPDFKDELYSINQYLTKQMNRILTAKELEILTSLVVEDRYTSDDIQKACEYLKGKGKLLSMRSLAQALAVKEEPAVRTSPKVVKDFIERIK